VPSRAEPISTLDADLKEASIQVIDLLQAAIRGISALIGISNRDGELLQVLAMAEQINAVPGGIWKEADGGTNNIGTGLALGKPIQIRLDEHYLPLIKQWNTCSAP